MLTILFVLTTLAQLQFQSSYSKNYARVNTLALAEALYGALHTSMLANDRPLLRQSVEQIIRRATNIRVRIFSKDGTIVFSSLGEEVGQRLNPTEEACFKCHSQGQPLEKLPPGEHIREFRWQGQEVIGAIRPIKRAKLCRGCVLRSSRRATPTGSSRC